MARMMHGLKLSFLCLLRNNESLIIQFSKLCKAQEAIHPRPCLSEEEIGIVEGK
jgi:hypothetical protein